MRIAWRLAGLALGGALGWGVGYLMRCAGST
jgi:hypothetical protein